MATQSLPGINDETAGIVLFDRATKWLQSYPVGGKTAELALEAFQNFAGPKDKIKLLYSDDAPELQRAAKWLMEGLNQQGSTEMLCNAAQCSLSLSRRPAHGASTCRRMADDCGE